MGTPQAFTGNPSDVHMGPASLTYKNRNLGYTLNDSVAMTLTMTSTPIQPDQASLPISDIVTGLEVGIKVTLGEVNSDNLKLIPGWDEASKSFKDPIGINLQAIADELIIVPLDSSDTKTYSFPKVTPLLGGDVSFARTTPQGLQLNFKGYVDTANAYLYIGTKA